MEKDISIFREVVKDTLKGSDVCNCRGSRDNYQSHSVTCPYPILFILAYPNGKTGEQ